MDYTALKESITTQLRYIRDHGRRLDEIQAGIAAARADVGDFAGAAKAVRWIAYQDRADHSVRRAAAFAARDLATAHAHATMASAS